MELNSDFRKLIMTPAWLPIPRNIRAALATQRLNKIIYRIIEERRRSGRDVLAVTHAGIIRMARALAKNVAYADVLADKVEHLRPECVEPPFADVAPVNPVAESRNDRQSKGLRTQTG